MRDVYYVSLTKLVFSPAAHSIVCYVAWLLNGRQEFFCDWPVPEVISTELKHDEMKVLKCEYKT
jgi:hypothetical protein